MFRSTTFCGANPRKTLTWLLVVLALVLLIRKWVCMPALVLGTSMSPTLQDRQVVLVNKLAYLLRPPARGDIVSIWTGRERLIKRIIGLPGEEVALKAGRLFVNGRVVLEPYLETPGDVEMAPGKIPVNSFGVIGDNRSGTAVALVNRSRIVGALVGRHKTCEGRASNPQAGKGLAGPPSSRPGAGTPAFGGCNGYAKATADCR